MEMYFESQWHRQPTVQEFQAMVEDKVREEVLYREALAMGLDKEDTIVKRRMAPSRPGEFHPEPLTDPDLNLSIHPARAIDEGLPPFVKTAGSSCRQLAL
jgi:hypothetical protein